LVFWGRDFAVFIPSWPKKDCPIDPTSIGFGVVFVVAQQGLPDIGYLVAQGALEVKAHDTGFRLRAPAKEENRSSLKEQRENVGKIPKPLAQRDAN